MTTWVRSWPKNKQQIPEGRPWIHDNLERLYMTDWDYLTVDWSLWKGEDLFLLEWDIALDAKGREKFEQFALVTPERVSAAMYYIGDGRFIAGMGCIYLPSIARQRFLETNPLRFTDHYFYEWARSSGGGVRVIGVNSGVHPQHLNT